MKGKQHTSEVVS